MIPQESPTIPHLDLGIVKENKNRYSFVSYDDRGNYYLHTYSQGTDEWYAEHLNRVTASDFGTAINLTTFCTPKTLAVNITNLKPRSLIENVKFLAQHGVKNEPIARNWYAKSRNVKIQEIGLAVPKWEPRIGASIDGDVVGTEGIIEIKSPLEMYKSLKDHMYKIETGWQPPAFYHNHIWEKHYAQIQGSLKIMEKKWCDYIVYAVQSNLVYVERIYFNEEYWEKTLWPRLLYFLDYIMEPLIN